MTRHDFLRLTPAARGARVEPFGTGLFETELSGANPFGTNLFRSGDLR
jgi:hypothetical protein